MPQTTKTERRVVTPEQTEAHFTGASGYAFSRWGRPIAPIVFGVDDATLQVVKSAIEAVVAIAGHQMTDLDPELGGNLMIFFLRDWDELRAVPDLGEMIPELDTTVARLQAADASQYRAFRFDGSDAIQACFSFVRMDDAMAALPAETIAFGQAVQAILLWAEGAFAQQSPLEELPDGQGTIVRGDIANLIRAAYDPMMPVAASDPSHALRLFARSQIK
jgi:hypothetical protein